MNIEKFVCAYLASPEEPRGHQVQQDVVPYSIIDNCFIVMVCCVVRLVCD